MEKFYTSVREHAANVINFDITVNRRRTQITSKLKSELYLWKKNLKKVC